jgi:hypothetical protein
MGIARPYARNVDRTAAVGLHRAEYNACPTVAECGGLTVLKADRIAGLDLLVHAALLERFRAAACDESACNDKKGCQGPHVSSSGAASWRPNNTRWPNVDID